MPVWGQVQIAAVKVLGVRASEQTRAFATYNSTVYCLLVAFTNGARQIVEVDAKGMTEYLPYISMQ